MSRGIQKGTKRKGLPWHSDSNSLYDFQRLEGSMEKQKQTAAFAILAGEQQFWIIF